MSTFPIFTLGGVPSARPALHLDSLRLAAAALVVAIDRGDNPQGAADALAEIAAHPASLPSCEQFKKLETQLLNRAHEGALPLMCDWRGEPRPHCADSYRAILDHHARARRRGLPAPREKYPDADQRAVVAALEALAAKLKHHQWHFREAVPKLNGRA